MTLNIGKEVTALERMTVGELRERYAELFDETTQARNRIWLIRRIIWRMQSLEQGDLSERARRRADELAGDSSNCLFLIACDEEAVVQRIVEGVRPLLSRFGGICLVSDCLWVQH